MGNFTACYSPKAAPNLICSTSTNHLLLGPQREQIYVFLLEEALARARPVHYSRRDYYKTTFLRRGHNLYHYPDKSLEATGPTLLFFDP